MTKTVRNLFKDLEQAIVLVSPICFILIIFSIESIAMSYINRNWFGMASWFAVGVVSLLVTKLISKRLSTN